MTSRFSIRALNQLPLKLLHNSRVGYEFGSWIELCIWWLLVRLNIKHYRGLNGRCRAVVIFELLSDETNVISSWTFTLCAQQFIGWHALNLFSTTYFILSLLNYLVSQHYIMYRWDHKFSNNIKKNQMRSPDLEFRQ